MQKGCIHLYLVLGIRVYCRRTKTRLHCNEDDPSKHGGPQRCSLEQEGGVETVAVGVGGGRGGKGFWEDGSGVGGSCWFRDGGRGGGSGSGGGGWGGEMCRLVEPEQRLNPPS